MEQETLFEIHPAAPALPAIDGLRYRADLLSPEEEADLLVHVRALTFRDFRMHGIVAKRKVAHFGWDYGYESWTIERTTPIPPWMKPIRLRCARLAGVAPETFEQALVAYYPAGAGIGWHRDAPMFGATVAGVSLQSACVMRFRRLHRAPRERSLALPLAPRSAYVLGADARSKWQHSIPPVAEDRYSITFRTVVPRTAEDDAVDSVAPVA